MRIRRGVLIVKSRTLKNLACFIIIAVLMLVVGPRAVLSKEAERDKWPKQFQHPKGTVVMYQPQLEDMKDDKLTAYAALSFQKKDWK